MTTPNRPKVFIKKIMPVELLNQQVYSDPKLVLAIFENETNV